MVAMIDERDRVYKRKKRQERERMYEGYQSFLCSWGAFPAFFWGVNVR